MSKENELVVPPQSHEHPYHQMIQDRINERGRAIAEAEQHLIAIVNTGQAPPAVLALLRVLLELAK